MSEEQKEIMLDLLLKKAIHGLDAAEQRDLDMLDATTASEELRSIEMTAAAISIAGNTGEEPLPAHLYSKILADSTEFVKASEPQVASPWPPAIPSVEKTGLPWFGWLGWAAAAVACVALVVNILITRNRPTEITTNKPPVVTPQALTPAEMREEMMRSTVEMVKAKWSAGNMKEVSQIAGDIVWSDEKQAGYMRLRGLPMNDKAKETYQLWIFDKTQDAKTPIDGGTFDVNSEGEVVIPINAKLKAKDPAMFAITMEKAGGVVVSNRKKIAALAKVENQTS